MRKPQKARGKTAIASSLQPPASSRSADLLLEIGTEELPAAYLPELIEQLGREAKRLLDAERLSFGRIETFGTPRRLVLLVRGLSGVQRKPSEELRGPSKQASYGQDGKPTQALLGFLRSRGGAVEQTKLVQMEKGVYVYLVKPPMEAPTASVLPDLLPRLVRRLRAPKTMRWDDGGVRFARPIRWLLALYGSRDIRCSLGQLTSGSRTWVGRPQRLQALTVRSIPQYVHALAKAQIILDQGRRRASILSVVQDAAATCGGAAAVELLTHGLLDEVTHLVEQPAPLPGAFEEKYLSLPREVLLASMAKYQRVFVIESSGRLLARFVAILDGPPRKPAAVQAVIERILNARLADSLLFWNQDRQRRLQEMLQSLEGVTFHERLGSMHGKTLRLVGLSRRLADLWGLSGHDRGRLTRAAELCKVDLVSAMVKEFPTLQGVIGRHYAAACNEAPEVAEAVEEHYLPLGGRSPRTLIGSALSILDKYDTLASYFSVDIVPTGDEDPFGLRRAAQGIVDVIWRSHRPLPFEPLFIAWQSEAVVAQGKAHVAERVKRYLLERLSTFAWPEPAPSAGHIEAVLAAPCDDLLDVMDRIVALRRFDGSVGLVEAAKVIERTANILKGIKPEEWRGQAVDPNRFQEPLERSLWDRYLSSKEELDRLIRCKAYADATRLFARTFYEPLHEFFDKVMVHVEDEAVRRNRLALMRAINTLYTDRIADLSKLAILQHNTKEP